MRVFATALVLGFWSQSAMACIEGMKCLKPEASTYTAPYAIGDVLPPGSFNVLLNSTYHGLPASDGSFWYVKAGPHVYKITPGTYEVLADVTHKARRLRR